MENNGVNTLIAGNGRVGKAVRQYISSTRGNGNIIGFVDDGEHSAHQPEWLGKLSDVEHVFQNYPFDQLIITTSHTDPEQTERLIDFSEKNGVRPAVVLDLPFLSGRNYEVSDLGGLTLVNLREVPLLRWHARLIKRSFDILFSLLVLTILSPVLAMLALAIRLDSAGPVFYRPIRIGKNGQRIRVFKFRSMFHEPDSGMASVSARPNDKRVTRMGRILRRFSLDELPQFLNVLQGEMSVVGPRPHRPNLDNTFRKIFPSYSVRRFVKPGITGWAQINGWRGLTETKIDFKARALHDLWYVEHWSFGLDLLIIFQTVFGRKSHQNVF